MGLSESSQFLLSQYLTPKQLLQECPFFKRSHLYRLVQRKEIPHIRVGRKIVFLRSSIDQWLKGLEQRPDECAQVKNANFNAESPEASATIGLPFPGPGGDV